MMRAAACGLRTKLITDAEWLAKDELAQSFEECVLLRDSTASENRSVAGIEETRMWHLFTEAAEEVNQATDPSLYWVHADAMNGPWSAPADLREQFVAEGDPAAATFTEPPHRSYDAIPDPDELLSLSQAYAAEVRVLDACLSPLLAVLEDCRLSNLSELTICVTSPRGYPLGEHRIVGDGDKESTDCLHSEAVNVPLLIRQPEAQSSATRLQILSQNVDLFQFLSLTVANDRGQESKEERFAEINNSRNQAYSVGSDGGLAVRTRDWSLIRPADSGSEKVKLFAKPDDRFEANDVAMLCPDVVESLESRLEEFIRSDK